jgi:hypothetical protein
MRKHDLHLERRQSWCVSTDPEFSRKAADVVGLYLHAPQNALVLCVDEKPCIQALERATRLRTPSKGAKSVADELDAVLRKSKPGTRA